MSGEPSASAAEDAAIQEWCSVLLDAVISGSVVDRSDGQPMPSEDDTWPETRTIPARALRDTLLSARNHQLDPQGLRLKGMRIEGLLDLQHIEFPHPLHLVDCYLADGLVMNRAVFKDIHLTGSHAEGLLLDRVSIDGDLFLDNGFRTSYGLSLRGAMVSGDINLCGALLRNPQGWALQLDAANVMGSVFAHRQFAAIGGIQAHSVRIDGQLRMANAVLYPHAGIALGMDAAKIEGGVDAERLSATGAVVANRTEMSAEFSLDGATIRNRGSVALALDGIHVKGSFVHAGWILETWPTNHSPSTVKR